VTVSYVKNININANKEISNGISNKLEFTEGPGNRSSGFDRKDFENCYSGLQNKP
jgi:hypothetical protein